MHIIAPVHTYISLLQVEDSELADVAAVSAGNNYEIGNMIADAMSKVGRKGVVTLEEGKSAENSLYVVEGMQFDQRSSQSAKTQFLHLSTHHIPPRNNNVFLAKTTYTFLIFSIFLSVVIFSGNIISLSY